MLRMKAEASQAPTTANNEDSGGGEPSVRVIDRAVRLLRALANHAFEGATFTELLREADLGKATTHRLLSSLVDAGLIYQDLGSKRYLLGSAVARMGQSAVAQRIAAVAQPSLQTLSSETTDTVLASSVEGFAAVCVARAIGSFPIRTLTLGVGDRRPLGVGSGSLALLAAMSDEEVEPIIDRNARWLRDYPGHGRAELEAAVREARRDGFALNRGGIVPGMSAVAVAALDGGGRPLVALAVAAITERLPAARIDQVVKLLKRETAAVSREAAS